MILRSPYLGHGTGSVRRQPSLSMQFVNISTSGRKRDFASVPKVMRTAAAFLAKKVKAFTVKERSLDSKFQFIFEQREFTLRLSPYEKFFLLYREPSIN